MPKIGLRMIKTSIAVFLCFLIYVLRNEQGIVFYSCIAAVLCVQQDSRDTLRVGKNRMEGTIIGGVIGMLTLVFMKYIFVNDNKLFCYLLISLMIIPTIYTTIWLKKPSASYISCVVFLSITVSHGADGNPYMFALMRMLDTFIGILVAYVVNLIYLPSIKESNS